MMARFLHEPSIYQYTYYQYSTRLTHCHPKGGREARGDISYQYTYYHCHPKGGREARGDISYQYTYYHCHPKGRREGGICHINIRITIVTQREGGRGGDISSIYVLPLSPKGREGGRGGIYHINILFTVVTQREGGREGGGISYQYTVRITIVTQRKGGRGGDISYQYAYYHCYPKEGGKGVGGARERSELTPSKCRSSLWLISGMGLLARVSCLNEDRRGENGVRTCPP